MLSEGLKFTFFATLAAIFFFIVLDAILPPTAQYKLYIQSIGTVVIFFGMDFIPLIVPNRFGKRSTKVPPSDELYDRVTGIARDIGTSIKKIMIDDSADGKRYMEISFQPGKCLLVSRKTLEVMSPEELGYFLRLKMVIPSMPFIRSLPLLFLPSAILGIYLHFAGWHMPVLLLLGLSAIALAPAFIVIRMARALSKRITNYDREKLARSIGTSDPKVAESATLKMLKYERHADMMRKHITSPEVLSKLQALDEEKP